MFSFWELVFVGLVIGTLVFVWSYIASVFDEIDSSGFALSFSGGIKPFLMGARVFSMVSQTAVDAICIRFGRIFNDRGF